MTTQTTQNYSVSNMIPTKRNHKSILVRAIIFALGSALSYPAYSTNWNDWMQMTVGNNFHMNIQEMQGNLNFWEGHGHHRDLSDHLEFQLIKNAKVKSLSVLPGSSKGTSTENKFDTLDAIFDLNSNSLVISKQPNYKPTRPILAVSGHAEKFMGAYKQTVVTLQDMSTLHKGRVDIESDSKGVGISVRNNGILNLKNFSSLNVTDTELGITVAGNKETIWNYDSSKNEFAATLNVENLDVVKIGHGQGTMRRAVFSNGDSYLNINTKNKIDINIATGWSGESSCDSGACHASSAVSGNGKIELRSNKIQIFGQHIEKPKDTEQYSSSYLIHSLSNFTNDEDQCILGDGRLNNSDILLNADSSINLVSNWGGIATSSDDSYHAKVSLDASDITISAAGATSQQEIDNYFKYAKDLQTGHSAIRALSGGKESNIKINGKNTVSIDYNKSDVYDDSNKLISKGDLNGSEAEIHHDLLMAFGANANEESPSASIQITGNKIVLNGAKANLRNIALADQAGSISLNADSQGSIQAYGNLTARNNGQIDIGLTSGSILDGSVFDHSYAGIDWSTGNEKPLKPADAGSITINGHAGGLWLVKPFDTRDLEFVNNEKSYSSTVDHLNINDNSTLNVAKSGQGFIVDLTSHKNAQRLLISHLNENAKNGSALFKLKFSSDGTGTYENDKLLIGEGTGNHVLDVVYRGDHQEILPNVLKDNYLVRDDGQRAKFELIDEGGVDIGLNKYQLTFEEDTKAGSNYWYLSRTEKPSDPVEAASTIAGSQRFLHWSDMQDLRKRLGEVRYGAQEGAWARYIAQKDEVDGITSMSDLEQKYQGINLGFDRTVSATEQSQWIVGLNGVVGKAEQETSNSSIGSGETDRYGLNLYATWADDLGNYADFVITGDYFKQDVTTQANSIVQKGNYDTWGFGVSAEVGKMFSTEGSDYSWGPWYRHTWIEPQLQLAYYWLKGANYDLSQKGINIDLEDDDSLMLRAGVVLGTKWNYGQNYDSIDRRYVQFQVKGGIKHDFMGDYRIGLNDQVLTKDVGGTTVYYGAGLDWQFNERSMLYMQVESETGDGYTKEYEISAGVKINFN